MKKDLQEKFNKRMKNRSKTSSKFHEAFTSESDDKILEKIRKMQERRSKK